MKEAKKVLQMKSRTKRFCLRGKNSISFFFRFDFSLANIEWNRHLWWRRRSKYTFVYSLSAVRIVSIRFLLQFYLDADGVTAVDDGARAQEETK